jgi:hypothetical protein
MKKGYKNMKRLILALAAPALLAGQAFAAIDWEAKGMQMATEILANPAGFFYDFQQDFEGTTPLPPGKTFGVQTGLWGGILPTAAAMPSLSGKVRLHGEGRLAPGVPQVDIIGGYWSSPLAESAFKDSEDIDNFKFNGKYYGLLVTSSVSPRVRTFWGFKHSEMKVRADFLPDADNKYPQLLGTDLKSFNTGFKDNFLIAGIETPKGVGKLWSMQLNYGLETQTISSKVSWYGKFFELGLNIYPEGVLVVHPVWNFHINF